MSSFPTSDRTPLGRHMRKFQSAVAHELISNFMLFPLERRTQTGFKALSRMSSFPTVQ